MPSSDPVTDWERGAEPALRCETCGSDRLDHQPVPMAFWEGDGLVVVEGIPALVCGSCGERFLSDETAIQLDRLRGTGFPREEATAEMTVPVFRFPSARE